MPTSFGNLPVELRLRIWQYTITDLTIIFELSLKQDPSGVLDHDGWESDETSIRRRLLSQRNTIAVLLVNREAYATAYASIYYQMQIRFVPMANYSDTSYIEDKELARSLMASELLMKVMRRVDAILVPSTIKTAFAGEWRASNLVEELAVEYYECEPRIGYKPCLDTVEDGCRFSGIKE